MKSDTWYLMKSSIISDDLFLWWWLIFFFWWNYWLTVYYSLIVMMMEISMSILDVYLHVLLFAFLRYSLTYLLILPGVISWPFPTVWYTLQGVVLPLLFVDGSDIVLHCWCCWRLTHWEALLEVFPVCYWRRAVLEKLQWPTLMILPYYGIDDVYWCVRDGIVVVPDWFYIVDPTIPDALTDDVFHCWWCDEMTVIQWPLLQRVLRFAWPPWPSFDIIPVQYCWGNRYHSVFDDDYGDQLRAAKRKFSMKAEAQKFIHSESGWEKLVKRSDKWWLLFCLLCVMKFCRSGVLFHSWWK